MDDSLKSAIDRIRQESLHIRNAAFHAAERHYAAETPWFYSIYWLGVPSAVLAAMAGAAAFSKLPNSEFLAGGISIVVAILSSLMTFLDPLRKATAHHTAAKGYEALYHSAGFFYRIGALDETVDLKERVGALRGLTESLNELNMASPPVPGRAMIHAADNIKNGWGEVVRDPDDVPIKAG